MRLLRLITQFDAFDDIMASSAEHAPPLATNDIDDITADKMAAATDRFDDAFEEFLDAFAVPNDDDHTRPHDGPEVNGDDGGVRDGGNSGAERPQFCSTDCSPDSPDVESRRFLGDQPSPPPLPPSRPAADEGKRIEDRVEGGASSSSPPVAVGAEQKTSNDGEGHDGGGGKGGGSKRGTEGREYADTRGERQRSGVDTDIDSNVEDNTDGGNTEAEDETFDDEEADEYFDEDDDAAYDEEDDEEGEDKRSGRRKQRTPGDEGEEGDGEDEEQDDLDEQEEDDDEKKSKRKKRRRKRKEKKKRKDEKMDAATAETSCDTRATGSERRPSSLRGTSVNRMTLGLANEAIPLRRLVSWYSDPCNIHRSSQRAFDASASQRVWKSAPDLRVAYFYSGTSTAAAAAAAMGDDGCAAVSAALLPFSQGDLPSP